MSSPALSSRARAALDATATPRAPAAKGLRRHGAGRARGAAGLWAQLARAERKQVAPAARSVGHAPLCAIAAAGAARFRASQEEANRCCSPGPTAACRSGGLRSRPCARAPCSPTTARVATTARATRPGTRSATPGRSARRDPPPRTIEPTEVHGDITLECDVVVVGSGAGGGTAAAVLAPAGLEVVVVEAGRYFRERDFDGAELSGYDRLYVNGGGMASADGSVGLLAAQGLGGTTLVNYTFSFRTPGQRCAASGPTSTASGPCSARTSTAASTPCWERIGVNSEHSLPSRRDETIREGMDKLGWDWEVMQRNVRGCTEEVCRLCHYGCQLGAKQSTLKTWVQDAHDAGTRILVQTRAERVLIENGAAAASRRAPRTGTSVTVRARAVVSACGALHTPALLSRSGVTSKALGKHLRLHPVLVLWGQFDEQVRPWEGMLSSTYSDQDVDMDGHGYGVKYEHVAIPPSILLSFSPWRGGRRARRADAGAAVHRRPRRAAARPRRRARCAPAATASRSCATSSRPTTSSTCAAACAAPRRWSRRWTRAGSTRRIRSGSPTSPGSRGDLDSFMRARRRLRLGRRPGPDGLVPHHGQRPHGRVADDSVCDPTGQVWGTPGLYVSDGVRVPDRVGREPDGHDRGALAHERPRPGREAGRGCLSAGHDAVVVGAAARMGSQPPSRWRRRAPRCWCSRRWTRSAAASARPS